MPCGMCGAATPQPDSGGSEAHGNTTSLSCLAVAAELDCSKSALHCIDKQCSHLHQWLQWLQGRQQAARQSQAGPCIQHWCIQLQLPATFTEPALHLHLLSINHCLQSCQECRAGIPWKAPGGCAAICAARLLLLACMPGDKVASTMPVPAMCHEHHAQQQHGSCQQQRSLLPKANDYSAANSSLHLAPAQRRGISSTASPLLPGTPACRPFPASWFPGSCAVPCLPTS